MNFKEFYALAQEYLEINAFAFACQSSLETGNWTSKLWREAFNGAGIKAGKSWTGAVYVVVSSEQLSSGKIIPQSSVFRQYPDPDTFIRDYAAKIKRSYPLCVQRRDNFIGVFDGLVSGPFKWATDQKYFGKLLSMAIKKAPEIFGASAHGKLQTALDYAINLDMLSQANIAIAINLIRRL